jgi:hypothetical protein
LTASACQWTTSPTRRGRHRPIRASLYGNGTWAETMLGGAALALSPLVRGEDLYLHSRPDAAAQRSDGLCDAAVGLGAVHLVGVQNAKPAAPECRGEVCGKGGRSGGCLGPTSLACRKAGLQDPGCTHDTRPPEIHSSGVPMNCNLYGLYCRLQIKRTPSVPIRPSYINSRRANGQSILRAAPPIRLTTASAETAS